PPQFSPKRRQTKIRKPKGIKKAVEIMLFVDSLIAEMFTYSENKEVRYIAGKNTANGKPNRPTDLPNPIRHTQSRDTSL
ncbi:MAG: hypothetical protein WBP85_10540, partial [Terracidiphilus sp.]